MTAGITPAISQSRAGLLRIAVGHKEVATRSHACPAADADLRKVKGSDRTVRKARNGEDRDGRNGWMKRPRQQFRHLPIVDLERQLEDFDALYLPRVTIQPGHPRSAFEDRADIQRAEHGHQLPPVAATSVEAAWNFGITSEANSRMLSSTSP